MLPRKCCHANVATCLVLPGRAFIRRDRRLPALETHVQLGTATRSHPPSGPGRRQSEDERPGLAAAPARQQPPARGPLVPPQRRAHQSGPVLLRPRGRPPPLQTIRRAAAPDPRGADGLHPPPLGAQEGRALIAARRQLSPSWARPSSATSTRSGWPTSPSASRARGSAAATPGGPTCARTSCP